MVLFFHFNLFNTLHEAGVLSKSTMSLWSLPVDMVDVSVSRGKGLLMFD